MNADPALAMMNLESEEMCFLASYLHEEKFGEMPDSGLSREAGSNRAGWPDLPA